MYDTMARTRPVCRVLMSVEIAIEGRRKTHKKMKGTSIFTRLGGVSSASVLFAATALTLVEAANVSDSSAPLFPASVEMPFPSVTGPLEDASCDVEQLEQANDSQLHVILEELMATSFFKSFAVDLKQVCHSCCTA